MYVKSVFVGELDWQSHENNYCLPPTWPAFDSCLDTVCGLSLLILYSGLIDFSQATPVFPSRGKLVCLDFSYCLHSARDFNKVIIVIVSSNGSNIISVVLVIIIIIIIIIILLLLLQLLLLVSCPF